MELNQNLLDYQTISEKTIDNLSKQLRIAKMALENIINSPLPQEYSVTIAELALLQINEIK